MVIRNEDVKEMVVEVPEGHKHLRAVILLGDGREFTFQEAAVASLVRAYITVKTHPTVNKVRLKGVKLENRKDGYADRQLVEDDIRDI